MTFVFSEVSFLASLIASSRGLGILKVRNEINCLRSVTGADRNHSSGVYFQ